jgi:hypothetical protein
MKQSSSFVVKYFVILIGERAGPKVSIVNLQEAKEKKRKEKKRKEKK